MRLISALLLALFPLAASADDRSVAIEYIRARCATLSKGATEKDVERVMALMHGDAVIEHPKFGAVVSGGEAIRRGMVSHLDEYTGDRNESGIVVIDEIESPGAVVFRTRTTFVVGEGPERQVISREGLTIVDVREGRIARLIEY